MKFRKFLRQIVHPSEIVQSTLMAAFGFVSTGMMVFYFWQLALHLVPSSEKFSTALAGAIFGIMGIFCAAAGLVMLRRSVRAVRENKS